MAVTKTVILVGKYYRYAGKVYRAQLCQFCNGRKVTQYHRCLFLGSGVIRTKTGSIFNCVGSNNDIEEVSETEFLLDQIHQL